MSFSSLANFSSSSPKSVFITVLAADFVVSAKALTADFAVSVAPL